MSPTVHGAKGLHKQAAMDHKAVQHHHEYVAVAAYYIAEHRGFKGGDPMSDWLAAEAEIEAALNKDKHTASH